MTTPANLPNQVGVQGIQALLALWIARAANAVNYLLARDLGQNATALVNQVSNYATTSTSPIATGTALRITPNTTGRVLLVASGLFNMSAATSCVIYVYGGTGTTPAQGAAASGSNFASSAFSYISGSYAPFTFNTVITGLTVGTSYWFEFYVSSAASTTTTFVEGWLTVTEL